MTRVSASSCQSIFCTTLTPLQLCHGVLRFAMLSFHDAYDRIDPDYKDPKRGTPWDTRCEPTFVLVPYLEWPVFEFSISA
jgi:hypothetical protein